MRWIAIGVVGTLSLVAAAEANTLEVRGELQDGKGGPEQGAYLLRFRLSSAAAGFSEAWSDSLYVRVAGGRFRARLGKAKPIPERLLVGSYQLAAEQPAALGWRVQVTTAAAPEPHGETAPRPEEAPPQQSAESKASQAPSRQAQAPAVTTPQEGAQPPQRRLDVAESRPAAKPPAARIRVYEVRAGDTLQSIAGTVWGDPARWAELYNANADHIGRGGYVEPGQRLIVPDGRR